MTAAARNSGRGAPGGAPRPGLGGIAATLLAAAVVITLVLAGFPGPGTAGAFGRTLLVIATITLAIGLPTWMGWRHLVPRVAGRHPGALAFALAGGGVVVGGVLLGAGLSVAILRLAGFAPPAGFFRRVIEIGLVVSAVVSAALVLAHRLLAETAARRLEAEEARRREAEARLEALRARVHPHFLFNALNTIAGLVHEDPDAAERAVEELARLLRYTLEASRADRVPLGDELGIVRRYLGLERTRLGDRLRPEITVEEGLETLAVPPLLVLPLVENAVRHGVAPRAAGGTVRVTACREDGELVVRVADDGPGPGRSPARGTGTSLADLGARLALLGGRLVTGGDAGTGFRAEVRLPLAPRAEENR